LSQHKQFEIMCALAAVGQINPSDLAELKQHSEDCIDCKRRLSEFAQVSAQALMLFGEKCSYKHRPPEGMTGRFVVRARAEGIPLQKVADSLPRELFHSLGWKGNIAAALLVLAVVAEISNRSHAPAFSTSSVVARPTATGEVPSEPKSVRVLSTSRSLESKPVIRRAKDHRRLESTRGSVPGAHSSELAFTASLELTPSSARYSANCDQSGVKTDSSLFSKVTEANAPRLFKVLATPQQTGPKTPWLLSLNSPSVFLYTTDRPSFLGGSQMGISRPNVDWSKIRLGVLSEFSRSEHLPQYQAPEQKWPFFNKFKLDTR
jgi:hypothetical protein